MKDVLIALNKIKELGVIDDYAIGGAVAAAFYIEAVNTEDVDVFLFLSPSQNSLLLSLTPIYDALQRLGGVIDREYVVFGDWPVQILPAYKPLVEAAIQHAERVKYDDVESKVFSPEYLCAIALDTARMKDFYRVASFIEQKKVDRKILDELIDEYQLGEKTLKVLNWNEP